MRRVAARADVPLDAAREPRIAQGEVRVLHRRVLVQQLDAAVEVAQRPDAPAELRQHTGAHVRVLDHDGFERGRRELALVAVLHRVGEEVAHAAEAHAGRDLLG